MGSSPFSPQVAPRVAVHFVVVPLPTGGHDVRQMIGHRAVRSLGLLEMHRPSVARSVALVRVGRQRDPGVHRQFGRLDAPGIR